MKKTAIVTGSSRGIGFAIARQLGLDGYNIVMVATGAQEKNQPALDTLQALGIDCAYVQANIGCTDDRKKILDTALAAFGRVDVLVNNTQESSDATNMLTGTAGRAGVPVFDVSEQMPQAYTTLTDWIADLVARLDKTVSPAIIDDSDESGSSDGKDGASAKNDAGNSADDKSDTGAGSSN